MIKSKNKQSEVQVINKSDFQEITEVDDAVLAQIEPLVQLNSKFKDIFQAKNCLQIVKEAIARSEVRREGGQVNSSAA